MKRKLVLTGCALIVASTMAFADETKLTESVEEFKAASSELIALFETISDSSTAEAMAPQIDAAVERMTLAEGNIEAVMATLDPTSDQDGAVLEKTFAELQAANDSVANAQLQALERQAKAETSSQ